MHQNLEALYVRVYNLLTTFVLCVYHVSVAQFTGSVNPTQQICWISLRIIPKIVIRSETMKYRGRDLFFTPRSRSVAIFLHLSQRKKIELTTVNKLRGGMEQT